MNRDEIIRMAREAGFCDAKQMELNIEWTCVLPELQHFAKLAEAAEREACAKLCDENTNPNTDKHEPVSQYQSGCYITAEYLAAAIRARSSHD